MLLDFFKNALLLRLMDCVGQYNTLSISPGIFLCFLGEIFLLEADISNTFSISLDSITNNILGVI